MSTFTSLFHPVKVEKKLSKEVKSFEIAGQTALMSAQ